MMMRLTFPEGWLCSRLSAKLFMCMISFDPHNGPWADTIQWVIRLTDEETEPQRTSLLCSTSYLASNWWNQVDELKSSFGFQTQGIVDPRFRNSWLFSKYESGLKVILITTKVSYSQTEVLSWMKGVRLDLISWGLSIPWVSTQECPFVDSLAQITAGMIQRAARLTAKKTKPFGTQHCARLSVKH